MRPPFPPGRWPVWSDPADVAGVCFLACAALAALTMVGN
jgi:hypothetical protein